MIIRDNYHSYRKEIYGILVIPSDGSWSGYYKLATECKLTLTGLSEGIAPGELIIPIRSWEDLRDSTVGKCESALGSQGDAGSIPAGGNY